MIQHSIMFRPVGDNCNLRCKYCYGSCQLNKINFLKQKNIIKIIKLFKNYYKSNIVNYTIYFHGGEPLLWGITNFEKTFKNILKLIDKKYVKFRVQTNAILLNKEFLDLFKKYNVNVSTSIDGSKEINDKLRVFPKDLSIYNNLINSINLLKKYKKKPGAISVVTKLHLNREQELYDFFKKINISIQFNPLLKLGRVNNNSNLLITPKEYITFIKNMFDIWFKDDDPIPISNFNSIVRAIIYNKPIRYCNYSKGCVKKLSFITIDYNGNMSVCNRTSDLDQKDFGYGNINNINNLEEIFDSKNYNILSKRITNLSKICKNCKLYKLNLCYGAGGCPSESFVSGNLLKLPYTCEINKKIVLYIYKNVMLYENEFRNKIKTKK